MPTSTTSAQLIRENQRNLIESLNPGQLARHLFKEYTRGDFRTWAEANPATCFRRFHIQDLSTYEAPLISDMANEQVRTTFRVTVAYPADNRYGGDEVDGLQDAIWDDSRRIDTSIGALGITNYIAGQNAAIADNMEIEQEDDVWFLVMDYDVMFYRAVDLGLTDLAGAISAAATVTGSVSQKWKTTGSISSSATVTGALTKQLVLTGSVSGSATMTGAMGPTLLADFDFDTPATVGIGGNGTFASSYATDEWLDFSSSPVSNNAGSETLANSGGLLGRVKTGLWNGTTQTQATGWESTNDTDTLTSSGTTACVVGTEDFSVRLILRFSGTPDATECVVSNYHSGTGAANRGWMVYVSADYAYIWLYDGTNIRSDAVQIPVDGSWFEYKAWYDYSAQECVSIATGATEQTLDTTTLGTLTPTTGKNFIVGDSIYDAPNNMQVAYVGVSVGANAQAFYDETVTLPGTDPTSLLTTQTRASLISYECASGSVAHYADDQLPSAWNTNFTTGNKLGLGCNSAVTNNVVSSEDLSTGWTTSNVSAPTLTGDAPDGFRSAYDVTATSNNGDLLDTFVGAGTTEYTFSVWVKRNAGSDQTFKLQLYDQTNTTVMILSGNLTATSSWQRFSVTGTSGSGTPTIRYTIRIPTSGESVLAWGAQVELGDGPTAYIRTSGASAATVYGNYQASGTAGQYCKGDKGEIELITVMANTPGSARYLMTARNTGASAANLLNLESNSGDARGRIYDSSGVSQVYLSEGAMSLSTEHTFVLQWDDSGGLALGGGEDGALALDGTAATTDVGSYTSTDTRTDIHLGNDRSPSSGEAYDGIIQRIRIWDGER